jgi:hypothetical protein
VLDYFSRHIDFYCERTGPELWSEPLNALTNLSFIVAGLWGLREAQRLSSGGFTEILGWWTIAIGIGSTLFHTFATEGTKWADILPIAIFTLVYTLFNLRRFLGLSWGKAVTYFIAFYLVVGLITYSVPDWLRLATNGSTGYLPPFLGLFVFGIVVVASGSRAGWYNIVAAAIFAMSVTFRAIDPLVCDAFPLGTHFLWHILNGLLLGVLLAAATRYGAPRSHYR